MKTDFFHLQIITNVNAPISLFDKFKSIGRRNQELEKLLKRKKFRLYEEPTIYFE